MLETMPHNYDAECSVLGSLLTDSKCKPICELTTEMFYKEQHKIIFQNIMQCEVSDIVTLSELMHKNKQLDLIGGNYYLTQLINCVPNSLNFVCYSKIIKDKYNARVNIKNAEKLKEMALSESPQDEMLSFALSNLTSGFDDINFFDAKEALTVTMDELEKIADGKQTWITTGINSLDDKILGLEPEMLYVIAGRPATGKTMLALNIITNIRKGGFNTAFFSLEMSRREIIQRMMASMGTINGYHLRNGKLSPDDWKVMANVAGFINLGGIYINDKAGLNLSQIKAQSHMICKTKNVDCICIDYLGLIRNPSEKGRVNRVQEISEIVRDIKDLARDLHKPIILLAQLNRDIDKYATGKKPTLSDLKESGEIEQTANTVIFTHNNIDAFGKPVKQLIIAKQRNGQEGDVEVGYEPEFLRFWGGAKGMDFDRLKWEQYESAKQEIYKKLGYTNKADAKIRRLIERMGL